MHLDYSTSVHEKATEFSQIIMK